MGIQHAKEHKDRPIILKCPAGLTSEEIEFKTCQEAIDFLLGKLGTKGVQNVDPVSSCSPEVLAPTTFSAVSSTLKPDTEPLAGVADDVRSQLETQVSGVGSTKEAGSADVNEKVYTDRREVEARLQDMRRTLGKLKNDVEEWREAREAHRRTRQQLYDCVSATV